MKFTSFITFLALFSRLTPINGLNPFFSLIFIILAIFLLDRTTAKLRRTLGLVTIWPFFDQKWLFFDIFLTKLPYLSSEITISKITSIFFFNFNLISCYYDDIGRKYHLQWSNCNAHSAPQSNVLMTPHFKALCSTITQGNYFFTLFGLISCYYDDIGRKFHL